ncbi:hypothetical protein DICPUDRAFT_148938 [Dictyostelium purpureum]|uniref:Uncharacterized protein n=1 Tax=Dictyostelium purpureum TaxID=5786 RepID=F0ZCD9_DICPU|nr:uncharacterized protein DICPUDRAFT_148938 [Dictyostelium purpureum]EGC38404.1 hypothetical protein DICPUDRAFT_148938 [Dictyostelium purpureum]|eukprot:XP_003285065.1 hypothetical protein DICPUDRAFT_148938 [Dictyostelium purpureum]
MEHWGSFSVLTHFKVPIQSSGFCLFYSNKFRQLRLNDLECVLKKPCRESSCKYTEFQAGL